MIERPKWWNGPTSFLVWGILAGVIVNLVIKTPNTVGGGEGMMFVIIALAVIFRATFQFLMNRRRKRKDEKINSPDA